MTVSRTIGKLRNSGPDRVERATAHLRSVVSFIVLQKRLPLPVPVLIVEQIGMAHGLDYGLVSMVQVK
jgi:hypothetical protein